MVSHALTSLAFTLAASRVGCAHTPPPVANPALDNAGDTAALLAVVALLGIAIYYLSRVMLSWYEKKHERYFHEGKARAGLIGGAALSMFAIWSVSAPPPPAVALAAVHVDKPMHGGQIQAIGNNHIELVVGQGRSLAVYVMSVSETIPYPIAETTLWAKANEGAGAPVEVLLHAKPQTGDPKGQTSAFEGELPASLAPGAYTLSLSLPLEGSDQQIAFHVGQNEAPGPQGASATHDTSAVKVVAAPITDEQRKLYLTPGGAYTTEDIESNGATTPEIKYAGLMANHHMNPKKGTLTCPITSTQANPKFSWILGGKKYLFCCPPCIAEFVKKSKTDPAAIKQPGDYMQM